MFNTWRISVGKTNILNPFLPLCIVYFAAIANSETTTHFCFVKAFKRYSLGNTDYLVLCVLLKNKLAVLGHKKRGDLSPLSSKIYELSIIR
jgi:hypothetical protein